jgi:hypothetical protein
VQVKAELRIGDPEAAIDPDDVKARRTRRARQAIDGAVRYAPARSSTS